MMDIQRTKESDTYFMQIHLFYADWIEAFYRLFYHLSWTPHKVHFNFASITYEYSTGPRLMKVWSQSHNTSVTDTDMLQLKICFHKA